VFDQAEIDRHAETVSDRFRTFIGRELAGGGICRTVLPACSSAGSPSRVSETSTARLRRPPGRSARATVSVDRRCKPGETLKDSTKRATGVENKKKNDGYGVAKKAAGKAKND